MSCIRSHLALGIIILLLTSASSSALGLNFQREGSSGLQVEEKISVDGEKEDPVVSEKEDPIIKDVADVTRKPISINNNTDFAEQAEENGWPGNGTVDDPYILEDYEIDAEDYGYGVYIGNVTDHFTLRDSSFKNATEGNTDYFKNSGVYLYNTSNGRIENNTVSNSSIGVALTDSTENLIVSNTVVNNTEGINLVSSTSNTLGDNQISENRGTGIHLEISSDGNSLTMNNVSLNQNAGVTLEDSHSNSITDHKSIGNGLAGLAFLQSDDNEVTTSTFRDNWRGIYMESSGGNDINTARMISNDDSGIQLNYSDQNLIEDNNISLNGGAGIHLFYSDHNIFNYTEVMFNTNYGIFLNNSEYNTVYHNNFINNEGDAYDSGLYNEWNQSYPEGGNYWGDHEGGDDYYGEGQNQPGSDGIIDVPYADIGGGTGAQDEYPLAAPVPTPHVRIENPTNGSVFSSSNITVEWVTMNRFPNSVFFEVRVDEEEWETVGGQTEHTLTKVSTGQHTIEVKIEDLMGNKHTDTVDIEVNYTVDDIRVTPDDLTVRAGWSQQYDAIGYNPTGDVIGFVPVDWSIEEDAGGEWDDDVYTSAIAGNWTITGSYDGIEDNCTLNVRPAFADGFKFEPIDDQIAGDSFEVSITALDEFGNVPENYTGRAELSDDTGSIEPNQTDKFTQSTWSGTVTITQAEENITIEALDENIFGESNPFDVGSAVLDEVHLIPGEGQTIKAGEELNFSAEAYDTLGNLITDEPKDFTWENATDKGLFNETESGEYEVKAKYDNLVANVTVIVEPAEANLVSIEPGEDLNITAGEEVNFSAEAYDEFDNIITQNESDFMWSAEGGFIEDGVFYEAKAGEYSVTAIFYEEREVKSEPTTVTVESAKVDEIVIEPRGDQTIGAGESIDFSAGAYDEYGNLINDVDTDFTWENTDETGLFEETTAGDHEIEVSYQGVSETLTVTVEPGKAERLNIDPDTDKTITAGETIDFSAEAYDEYDNLITDDDEDFTWENTDPAGLFKITQTGQYRVTASYGGMLSQRVFVEVEPAEVAWVEIDPSGDKVITSLETLDFSAQAYDEHGNMITEKDEDFMWENATEEGLFNKTEEKVYHVRAAFEEVISPTTEVEVVWEEYKIEIGPILDVNNDPVTDASVTLSWGEEELQVGYSQAGRYEVKVKLPWRPEKMRFNTTIEHEDLSEPEIRSFNGTASGELVIDEIGEEPAEPAGVGLTLIVILILLIVIIIIAAWFSIRKSKDLQPIQQYPKVEKKEEEEEDFLDEMEKEKSKETTSEDIDEEK